MWLGKLSEMQKDHPTLLHQSWKEDDYWWLFTLHLCARIIPWPEQDGNTSRNNQTQFPLLRRGCQQEEERHTSSPRGPRITCDFLSMLIQTARGSVRLTLVETIVFKSSHKAQHSPPTMISVVQGGDLPHKQQKTAAASQTIGSMTSGCGLISHTIFFFFMSLLQLTLDFEWRGSYFPKWQKNNKKKTGPPLGKVLHLLCLAAAEVATHPPHVDRLPLPSPPMPAFYIYPACLADDVASSWPRAFAGCLGGIAVYVQVCVWVTRGVCVACCNVPHRFASLPLS